MKRLLPLLLLSLATGCGQGTKASPAEAPASGVTPANAVAAMNAEIDALMKKPEHQAAEITVQHILIGVAGRLPGVTRTPAEAEKLAAELLTKIHAGEDFDTLVKNNTNDTHPGIYTMSAGEGNQAAGIHARNGINGMVPAFGDVGWRLQVDEVGVAAYDGAMPGGKPKSPFGYHIIKRLK